MKSVFSTSLTSIGYSSSIRPRWFPCSPSSSWSGESDGSGGGGEWARARDWPGEPAAAFWSRSTTRVIVGEVPVRSATAWSCLASVMSTPLIWIDSKSNRTGVSPPEHCPLVALTGWTLYCSLSNFWVTKIRTRAASGVVLLYNEAP